MPQGLSDILAQMQQAQGAANQANEQRYQDILAKYSNLGKAGTARIGQQTEQAQAKATQDLTSRGLGNTTITSAVSRGIAGDAELQQQQLDESVSMQQAGVMERRTDQGPDMGLYANLIQNAAAAPQQQRGGGGRNMMWNPVAGKMTPVVRTMGASMIRALAR